MFCARTNRRCGRRIVSLKSSDHFLWFLINEFRRDKSVGTAPSIRARSRVSEAGVAMIRRRRFAADGDNVARSSIWHARGGFRTLVARGRPRCLGRCATRSDRLHVGALLISIKHAHVRDHVLLVILSEGWSGWREISDLRIGLRLFHMTLGFWRNASERTAAPGDIGNSRKCMPQMLADPHFQHE